jgi:hypothetical protein
MLRRTALFALVAGLALFLPTTAEAAKKPPHSIAAPAAACTVDGNTVSVTGLPLDVVVNFFVTDSTGTTGWVLGVSGGWWNVEVPAANGPTTYEFASKTWGNSGENYTVYASCSV